MNKNIAFVIPSLKNGGAERVLSTISMNLDENINQYIFTWNGKEQDYDFNGKIVDIDIQNSTNLIKNIKVLFNRVKEVKKYKKEYKIDTCVSHLEGPNIVNLLSKVNEKTIITVHNFQSKERTGLYGFIFKILIKLLYNRADKIVVVSKAIKEDLINNFNINAEKIEVIYNPFDCKKIEDLAKEALEEEYIDIFKNEVIINVGRLSEQKGQIHLINSFNQLQKKKKGVKLVILGRGNLENELKEIVKKYKLEEDVLFLGFQKNPFKFIAKSKIFALTSLYEGFPMCLIESMACGTTVVSVDCKSGPREMLNPNNDIYKESIGIDYCENGILVKQSEISNSLAIYNNENLFAEALINILNDENAINKYEIAGKKRAMDFDVKKIIEKWNEII